MYKSGSWYELRFMDLTYVIYYLAGLLLAYTYGMYNIH